MALPPELMRWITCFDCLSDSYSDDEDFINIWKKYNDGAQFGEYFVHDGFLIKEINFTI